MTLTVRLPDRVEQELAEYCTIHDISKSEAVKRALRELLSRPAAGSFDLKHPYIGCESGPGDIARHTTRLLRKRFRGKGSRG